jgi:hypothetical protein
MFRCLVFGVQVTQRVPGVQVFGIRMLGVQVMGVRVLLRFCLWKSLEG